MIFVPSIELPEEKPMWVVPVEEEKREPMDFEQWYERYRKVSPLPDGVFGSTAVRVIALAAWGAAQQSVLDHFNESIRKAWPEGE